MRRSREIYQYRVNLIRRASRRLESSGPLAGAELVEVCAWAEWAGMPAAYSLSVSVLNYTHIPDGRDLAVVLAERVGNSRVSPVPTVWPLLALVLLAQRERLSGIQVMGQALDLGIEQEVERGLAIVVHLFPELEAWSAGALGRIPRWEKLLAVPLAARKLVLVEESE